jgi:hypothetical protein
VRSFRAKLENVAKIFAFYGILKNPKFDLYSNAGKVNRMEKITVVWNNHGEGTLIGVFNDKKKIKELKQIVLSSKQQTYLKFFEVEMNHVDEEHLLNYAD